MEERRELIMSETLFDSDTGEEATHVRARSRFAKVALAGIVIWSLAIGAWFASAEPTSRRFWDERFSIDNIENVLAYGTLRPHNGWYGRLSFLPQTAVLGVVQFVYERTGIEGLAMIADSEFTPSAYLVARWTTLLYGIGSLFLTFLVGRRVFTAEVAVMGTALLATSPWIMRHFVTFKPDALVILLTLATFSWSLDALERRSLARFAIAGIGVGLATSAKYTGALAAVMVVAAAVSAWDGWRKAFTRLATAGLASVAVFLCLHPDLGFYLSFLGRQHSVYTVGKDHSFWEMLVAEASNLLHWSFHGPFIGVLALAGFGALCLKLCQFERSSNARPHAGPLAVLLSFPLAFSLVYALVTRWPKGNNYLIIVPFTALAAGWLLGEGWRWLAPRISGPARGVALALALAGFGVFEFWPANAYVYEETIGTKTLDRVAETMVAVSGNLSWRSAFYESWHGDFDAVFRGPGRRDVAISQPVASLTEVPELDLDLADFEVFPEARFSGPQAGFYESRLRRLPESAVLVVEPEWFEVVGAPQVLLIHRWSVIRKPELIEWERTRAKKGLFMARLPRRLRENQPISLEARVPKNSPPLDTIQVGDVELAFFPTGWDEYGDRFATRRFLLSERRAAVHLKWDKRPGTSDVPRVAILRWKMDPLEAQ